MDRTPALLAALASAAVPSLDPTTVEALPSLPEHEYDVAFVRDSQHRRWVVRVPRTATAAARLEQSAALLTVLSRRLPFAVPTPKGYASPKTGGRAVVYPFLPGLNIEFAELPAGPGLAAELGRAIAAVHNADQRLFEEAGAPAYDAEACRRRLLSDLDRAAQTRRVPSALLQRWEAALEDVALWRFSPVPVHGDLSGDQVLVVFENDEDAASGRVRGVTGWEDAQVGDPAGDFAWLVAEAPSEALDTVLEAYAHSRTERPDPNLAVRARLHSELQLVRDLLRALAEGIPEKVEVLSEQLQHLADALNPQAQDEAEQAQHDLSAVAARPAVRVRSVAVEMAEEPDDLGEVDPFASYAAEADENAPGDDLDAGSGDSSDDRSDDDAGAGELPPELR